MLALESERLRLIPLGQEDLDLFLARPQEVERKLGVSVTGRTVIGSLRQALANSVRWMRDDPANQIWYSNWQIVHRAENRIIGSAGFKGPPNHQGEVEIGYGLDEVYRNRGYTTEAVREMVRWALAQPGVAAVTAETLHTNIPSMRVLSKAGLVPVRATDQYLYWRTLTAPHRRLRRDRQPADEFDLYDLEVVVEQIEGHCTCNMRVGDRFYLQGGQLSLPADGRFCVYALQAALPLLPAKQRQNHPADWIETDSRVTCPDPACRLIMRIDRVRTRTLRHDDVSPIPWADRHDPEG